MKTKMARRRNIVVAAVAGMALLVGGSAYSLWSATGSIQGGDEITAGNMELNGGESNAWDVSGDRANNTTPVETEAAGGFLAVPLVDDKDPILGTLVDLATWKIVPGDTIALTFPFQITLQGDNLAAELTMPGAQNLIDKGEDTTFAGKGSNLTLEYQVFGADGKAMGAKVTAGNQNLTVAYFETNANVIGATYEGNMPVKTVDPVTGEAVVTLVLYITFDKTVTDRIDAGSILKLSQSVEATLAQVRCVDDAGANFPKCEAGE